MPKCDAVFEGGGVKGIGLVGAMAVTEQAGYEFVNVAGTSAGAIVAALVAAGYGADELRSIMRDLDYAKFKDEGLLDKIPIFGKIASLGFEKGIYEGEYLENWIRDKLAAKGKRTFRDLVMRDYQDQPAYRYRLRVIATDISCGRLLALPQDIRDYGIEPDDLDIAHAVRMSMSIPYFFEPVELRLRGTGERCYIVDGGVLSNFPVNIFDDGTADPSWPTFGYMLAEAPEQSVKGECVLHNVRGPLTLFAALFSTMMEAHDRMYIRNSAFARTVMIPTLGVKTTEFDLSPDRAEALYQSGVAAATDFFKRWDFADYKQKYRQQAEARRRETV